MRKAVMSTLTTKVPFWETDCDKLKERKRTFELQDVRTEAQEVFAIVFASRHGFSFKRIGTTVFFEPRKD